MSVENSFSTDSHRLRDRLEAGHSLLDQVAEEGRLGQSREERSAGKEGIRGLIEELAAGAISVSKDTETMINGRIAALDAMISRQLTAVMHSAPLQQLEASWRGLQYLVQETETSSILKIKILNVSKAELFGDLARATQLEHTQIFRKIYEEEVGTVGGTPFGALIGDYEFGCDTGDVALLEKMAGVAAVSQAPFIAAAAPAMFNFETFMDLASPRDLERIFDSPSHVRWNVFRKSDDARYVGLCMPHILIRLPYGKDTHPVEEFDFEEEAGTNYSHYLWGNAAYAFAARLTDAFARFQWCAAIRGVEGGGLVENLPALTFTTDDGDVATKCPTEIAITDRRENELARLGFIPLCYYRGAGAAVFMGAQSAQKPQIYPDSDANANSRLSVQLQYILACSRFAHFMQVMLRDKVGSLMSRHECEAFLNKWISNYVLLDDAAPQDLKAKFPLREAHIEVNEEVGKPGIWTATAYLRPHFQLDELTVSLRLVVRLPRLEPNF